MAQQEYSFERNDGRAPLVVRVADGVSREQALEMALSRDASLQNSLVDLADQSSGSDRPQSRGFTLEGFVQDPVGSMRELGGAAFGALQGIENAQRYGGAPSLGPIEPSLDMAAMTAGAAANITRPQGEPPRAGVSTPTAGGIRGATIGGSEELGALLQEGVGRPLYSRAMGFEPEDVSENIDQAYTLQAEQLEEERRTRGGQQMAAEIAGGSAVIGPSMGTGGTIGGMALRGAAAGGFGGAAGGFLGTENQGLNARLQNAAIGTAIGGPLGAVLGPAIPIAERALAPAASRASRTIMRRLGLDEGDIRRIAQEGVEGAPQDPRLIGERLGPAGRESMVGVPGLTQEAQEIGANAMARRIPEFRAEVTDAFASRSGVSGQGGRAVIRSSQDAQRQAGQVFNDLAPVQVRATPELRANIRLIGRRDPNAISYVDSLGQSPTPLARAISDDAVDGPLTIGQLQTLAIEAEDAAGAAFSAGRGQQGRQLADAARGIRNQIKAQSPEFADASRIYSSEFRIQQAANLGRNVFSGSRSVQDEIADLGPLDQLNAGERAAFMEGMLEAVERMAGRADEIAGDPSRPFRSGNVRDVIRRIYGDEADGLLTQLDDIGQQYSTLMMANRSINAATAGRLAAETRVAPIRGQSAIADVIESPTGAITMSRQRQNIAESLRRGETELNARTAAELLFAPSGDGQAARQFMEQVNQRRAAQGLAPLPAQAAMALFIQQTAEGRPMGPLGPAAEQ